MLGRQAQPQFSKDTGMVEQSSKRHVDTGCLEAAALRIVGHCTELLGYETRIVGCWLYLDAVRFEAFAVHLAAHFSTKVLGSGTDIIGCATLLPLASK